MDLYRRYDLGGFGLPVHLLPERIKTDPNQEDKWWPKTYNKTIGSVWYQENMKSIVEKSLGGSLRFFMKNMSGGNYYREPQRTTLSIRAAMPEGCTVQQLNDIMKMMENFLSQFDEIDMFKTSIYGYNDGSIEVTFKKDAEHTRFSSFPEKYGNQPGHQLRRSYVGSLRDRPERVQQ